MGYLLVLGATAIASGNFIVARALSDSIPPVTLAFLRWTAAVIVLSPFAIRPLYRDMRLVRRHFAYLSLTAFLGVTLFNTLIYIAAHTLKALNLTLIAICSPVFIVLFGRLFLSEPLTCHRLIGLVTATLGVVVLVTNGQLEGLTGLTFSKGDVWMLVAAGIFAAYSILVQIKPAEMTAMLFVASTFILGWLFLTPWFIWELTEANAIDFSPIALGSVAYLGIGPSLLCFLCWNQAITIIGPIRAGFVYYSLPLFSGIEALLLLGEPISGAHLLSGVLILAGVTVATRDQATSFARRGTG